MSEYKCMSSFSRTLITGNQFDGVDQINLHKLQEHDQLKLYLGLNHMQNVFIYNYVLLIYGTIAILIIELGSPYIFDYYNGYNFPNVKSKRGVQAIGFIVIATALFQACKEMTSTQDIFKDEGRFCLI